MNITKLIEERNKEFDKEFGGWTNTKFDCNTGEVEHIKDTRSIVVVAKRKDLHKFNNQTISLLLEEIVKMVEGMKRKDNRLSTEIYNEALANVKLNLKYKINKI